MTAARVQVLRQLHRGVLVVTALAAVTIMPPLPRADAADPRAVEGRGGMVVAAEPLAADAGVAMLARGGNAVDAAVATGFALAVTYPVAGNLGGGGFMVGVLRGSRAAGESDEEWRRFALDFRETAPAAATRDLYLEAEREDASTVGLLAAGVPGSVAGLLVALERWGTLDRHVVLAPAIRLARDGFAVPRRLHRFLAADATRERMMRFPETARIFYPGGEPLAEGALFRQPDLARTLERIAAEGRAGFYEGATADAIASEMQRGGGIMTREDLRSYRSRERAPHTFEFRGRTVVSMPPPSSGGVCLEQMLAMLEPFPLERFGSGSSQTLHLYAEAMRRSFADRNRYLGDPDHVPLPLAKLLDRERLRALGSTIRLDVATPSALVLDRPLEAPGREKEQTTHYSVVDASGSAVSVTTTLNGAFGAKVVVPGTGVLLNNEMDDFAARPGEPNLYGLVQGDANAIAPGKRPLSSMTPTVVLDAKGRPELVLGTPGGPTIITNVMQVLLELVLFGKEPQAAVNAPKIHHQCIPDQLYVEPGFASDVTENLERRGHEVAVRNAIGDFQLIQVGDGGVLYGASDPRGGGAARAVRPAVEAARPESTKTR